MRTISHTTFTTVKTEGAILPADLLQRIAEGQGLPAALRLDGLRPDDYHLAPNERLNEAINRSWNRCLGAWASFNDQRARLSESDAGTTLTRERWLLILFQELGYGRLQIARSVQIQGTSYPISHLWGNTPIHLVSFRQDLDRRDSARSARSPHSLVQVSRSKADCHAPNHGRCIRPAVSDLARSAAGCRHRREQVHGPASRLSSIVGNKSCPGGAERRRAALPVVTSSDHPARPPRSNCCDGYTCSASQRGAVSPTCRMPPW